MYTLFATKESYAMTAHMVLEELGLDYEVVWADLSKPVHERDPAHLAVHPEGRVPSLVTPEGPLFETGAILVHLAESHPEAGLIPAVGDPLRRRYWQWHFYLASFFQREAFIQSVPGLFLPETQSAQGELLAQSMARLRVNWQTLNDAILAGPYILGARFTTCDIAFAMQALWDECHPPEGLGAYPHALRCLRRILQRPAAQAVLEAHGAERLARI